MEEERRRESGDTIGGKDAKREMHNGLVHAFFTFIRCWAAAPVDSRHPFRFDRVI